MKNFNIIRFGNLMKLDLMRNKRTYLYAFLSMLVGFLIIQFGCFYTFFKGMYYSPLQIESAHENMFICFLMVEYLYAMVCISSSFTFLRDKDRRISYLLIPATPLEKFWSRIVIHTLGMFLLSLVAFVLSDWAMYAVFSVFQDSAESMLPYLFTEGQRFISHLGDMMFDNGEFLKGGIVSVLSLLSYSSMMLSIYLFASMVFRKHPFILMSLCLISFLVLFAVLVTDKINDSHVFFVFRNDGYQALVFIVLTIFFTSLSYVLFKRKGAVHRTLC